MIIHELQTFLPAEYKASTKSVCQIPQGGSQKLRLTDSSGTRRTLNAKRKRKKELSPFQR